MSDTPLVEDNEGDEPVDISKQYSRLIYNLRLTIGSRFNASRRHKNRNRTSMIAIVILSSYSLLFSMISTFMQFENTDAHRQLGLFSVFMSALIIAFSLFESVKRHDARAELFAKSAVQLSDLRDRISICFALKDINPTGIREFYREYNEILQTFGDSHAEIDYQNFRATIDKSNDRFSRKGARRRLFLHVWIMPIIAILSPFLLYAGVIVGKIMYYYYGILVDYFDVVVPAGT